MQRFIKFIVVFLLLVSNQLFAQVQQPWAGLMLKTTSLRGSQFTVSALSISGNRIPVNLSEKPDLTRQLPVVSVLAGNIYVQHLAFFCKAEYQLEQKINIRLRVRLGSLQQVDWLEGKHQSFFSGHPLRP